MSIGLATRGYVSPPSTIDKTSQTTVTADTSQVKIVVDDKSVIVRPGN